MNTRANRGKTQRRERTPNLELKRSRNLSMTPEGYVSRAQESDTVTEFGRRRMLFKGDYEIFMESLAPKVSLGNLQNEKGTLTIFVNSGTIFVNVESEKTNGITKVRSGEHMTFTSDMTYSISTGEVPVTLMKVQTRDYDESVQLLSEKVTATDAEGALILEPAISDVDHVSPEGINRKPRASYNPEYRKHVAEGLQQDNVLKFTPSSANRRKEREARQPRRSAAEAAPHSGQTFIDPVAVGEKVATFTGLNAQAVNMAELDALEQADYKAGE